MKKTALMFLCLMVLLTGFYSCKKENKYSCDEGLNDWAVKNARSLEVSTRANLAEFLTIDSQFAAYRIMTPAAQCSVWRDKLMIVYSEFDLTIAEKAHVMNAYNHLAPSMFEDEESLAALKIWAENWQSYAQTVLSWSDDKAGLIAGTWLTGGELDDYKEYRLSHTSGGGMSTGPGGGPIANPASPDCECYYSVYCSLRGDGTCNDGGCTTKNGCGVFGTSNCSGRCY